MRPALAVAAALSVVALAGCMSDSDDDEWRMGPGSYRMHMSGMPAGPMHPGQMFDVSVEAGMGSGMGMHRMSSDHIGAHFWNRTVADPTSALGDATTCQHTGGEAPGQWTATCTAPMEPGTYHLRSHMRMMDDDGQMHHWWSDEQSFTVE